MLLTSEQLLSMALKSGKRDRIEKIFNQIYEDYVRLVAFYVSRFISDEETIKDITNDVFMDFFANASQVNTSIKGYLCSKASSKAIDYLRREKRIVINDSLDDIMDSSFESSALYEELIKDMERTLSNDEVKIIIWHAVMGLSFQEIGKKLNIKANNANVIYFRAIRRFRKHLESGRS